MYAIHGACSEGHSKRSTCHSICCVARAYNSAKPDQRKLHIQCTGGDYGFRVGSSSIVTIDGHIQQCVHVLSIFTP